MLLVDDALLLRVLAGLAEGDIAEAAERGEIFTTGSRYYRLGMALRSSRWLERCGARSVRSLRVAGDGCWPPWIGWRARSGC
jgi:hypothetical protein